ncbi:hypothetical protein BLOT_005250 [Blomia tropicalis]|nr:hypothetical protein BLOT_005250 [Blomia tropicalis]
MIPKWRMTNGPKHGKVKVNKSRMASKQASFYYKSSLYNQCKASRPPKPFPRFILNLIDIDQLINIFRHNLTSTDNK